MGGIMNIFLLAIRLILAAVFGIAALSKLRDTQPTHAHMLGAGLPHALAGALAIGLPLVEIGIAIALISEPFQQAGAWVALLLLIAFSAYIVWQLVRGNRAACNCFGTLTHAPLGPALLVRNAALALMAGLLLITPPVHLALSADVVALAALSAGTVALAYWCVQLTRQQGRLLLRIERIEQLEPREWVARPNDPLAHAQSQLPKITAPLQAGQRIPDWPLLDVHGTPINLRDLLGAPSNILFLDQTCLHCRALFLRLRDWVPVARTVVFVSGYRASQTIFASGITVVDGAMPDAMRVFGIQSTPAAIQVNANGNLIGSPITGASAVMALLEASSDSADPAPNTMEVPHAIAAL